ncbi:MAG: hypothetical protein H6686_10305 [Fibrobacteria bacterium]|nr:hypothetical protein [Fibrobacteria bacterium]
MILPTLLAACTWAAELPLDLDLLERGSVREALERVATRAGVELPRASWPLSNREVVGFLARIRGVDSTALTPSDSVVLRDFLQGPRELWRWEEGRGGSVLALNARTSGFAMAPDTAPEASRQLHASIGGTIYGNVGGEVWFLSDARIFTEWSDAFRYRDRHVVGDGEPSGVPYDDPSENGRFESRTGARYVAWAQWSRDWISLKYGRDRVRFGPGVWTGLTTRLESPPYNLLDTRLEPFPWLSVQATVLEARPGELEYAFPGDTRKWVHVHRFELRPFTGVTAAFQNMVLYRDSGGVQPTYLLPLVPIFFSQDLAGNRDNSAMQFDLMVQRWRGWSTWGALFLDDLNSLTDIGGASWLNRWGILTGARILSPWRSFDADLSMEFSMVRPWTFTGGREEAYSFAHYGMAMGSELGPDSRTLHARAAWRPTGTTECSLEAFRLEKGVGAPATLGTVHRSTNGPDSYLMEEGNVESTGATLGGKWSPWRDVTVGLSGTWDRQTDVEGESGDHFWGRVTWEADW